MFGATVLPAGLPLVDWKFLSELPTQSGRSGGISSILVSTLCLLVICMTVAAPMSIAAGSALATAGAKLRHRFWIRLSLDVLASLPSVVFGLFGNALFCRALGLGFSLLSGGLTLACMVLPVMVRASEAAIATLPREYELAAAALGMSEQATLLRVLIPAARRALIGGALLAGARALAETTALVFTSGYVTRMPSSVLDSGRSLSVHVYDLTVNVAGGTEHAHATILVLVSVLLFASSFAYRATPPGSAR
jgi:phosphate transport system permease protein